MEDNLNIWRMEDNLNIWQKGKQPQNPMQPQLHALLSKSFIGPSGFRALSWN
jgi:hypothetical protein